MAHKRKGIRLEYAPGSEIMLEFKWSVSRAQDSYGYNVCTLRADGVKVSGCNGGGYDMLGTCLGHFVAGAFESRLRERIGKGAQACENCSGTGKIQAGNIILGDALQNRPWNECPKCRGTGKGGAFYGLTFHDPDYDPGKAVVEADTFGGKGLTVAEAEAQGKSLGLDRYQAFYSAAAPLPDDKRRIPLIDGACGWSSVQSIAEAIGLRLERINVKGRDRDDRFYRLIVGE
jgi:hypothetical protein